MGRKKKRQRVLSGSNSQTKTSKQPRLDDPAFWGEDTAVSPRKMKTRITVVPDHHSTEKEGMSEYDNSLLALLGEHCIMFGKTVLAIFQKTSLLTSQIQELQMSINKCLLDLTHFQKPGPARNKLPTPVPEHSSASPASFAITGRGGGDPTHITSSRRLLVKRITLEITNSFLNTGRWANRYKILDSLARLLRLEMRQVDLNFFERLPSPPFKTRLMLEFVTPTIPFMLFKMKKFLGSLGITTKRVFTDTARVPPWFAKQSLPPHAVLSRLPREELAGSLPLSQPAEKPLASPSANWPENMLSQVDPECSSNADVITLGKATHDLEKFLANMRPIIDLHPSVPPLELIETATTYVENEPTVHHSTSIVQEEAVHKPPSVTCGPSIVSRKNSAERLTGPSSTDPSSCFDVTGPSMEPIDRAQPDKTLDHLSSDFLVRRTRPTN